jgi:hypothetical protein
MTQRFLDKSGRTADQVLNYNQPLSCGGFVLGYGASVLWCWAVFVGFVNAFQEESLDDNPYTN